MSTNADILRQLLAVGGGHVVPGSTIVIASTNPTSARDTSLTKHTAYLVCSDAHFYFKLGTAAVTAAATDQRWPANVPLVLFSKEFTALAVLSVAGAANVFLSKLEFDPEAVASPATGQYAS